jgi:hypothetical protein
LGNASAISCGAILLLQVILDAQRDLRFAVDPNIRRGGLESRDRLLQTCVDLCGASVWRGGIAFAGSRSLDRIISDSRCAIIQIVQHPSPFTGHESRMIDR